jgi:hypothetical protein
MGDERGLDLKWKQRSNTVLLSGKMRLPVPLLLTRFKWLLVAVVKLPALLLPLTELMW